MHILFSTHGIGRKTSKIETIESIKDFGKSYRSLSKLDGDTFPLLTYKIQSCRVVTVDGIISYFREFR